MRNFRHSAISLGLALAIASLLLFAGMSTGLALILGAAAGIMTSLAIQRREAARTSGPIGGSDEPADIDAAYAAASAAISELPAQATSILDEPTRLTAERISDLMSRILQQVDATGTRGIVPLLVDQLVEPAQALLTDYLWLQKRPESVARDAMAKISLRDLPSAELSARQVLALLERPGEVDISALRRAVDFQFSFGGETAVPSADMWGNRQALVDAAEREKSG